MGQPEPDREEQGRKGCGLPGKDRTLDTDRLRLVRSPAVGRNHMWPFRSAAGTKPVTVQFSLGASGKDTGQLCISSPGCSPWGLSQDPYWVLLGSLLGLGLRHFLYLDEASFTPSPSLCPSPLQPPEPIKWKEPFSSLPSDLQTGENGPLGSWVPFSAPHRDT